MFVLEKPSAAPGGAPTAAVAVAGTRLGAILAGKTHEVVRVVDLPRIGPVAIRLLRRAEAEEVDIEVTTWLVGLAKQRGLAADELMAAGTVPISSRTFVETLARAVRSPEDPSQPFGTVAEWAQLDDEVLGEAVAAYDGLRAELDPLSGALTPEEFDAIVEAGKKNDRIRLFGFGASKLSACVHALVSRPAS